MDALLGRENGLAAYGTVLLLYAALFIVMRYARPALELNFRRTYWVLFFGWGIGVFIGNYCFFLAGWMSYLPWVNNALHTFVWIGLCLGFLYAGCRDNPLPEQFALFFIFSFLVKWGEHQVLGTWELDHFFFLGGNLAYILGWSMLDGLYPVISRLGLAVVSKFTDGIIVPE